jgi:Putative cell wall-binding domain
LKKIISLVASFAVIFGTSNLVMAKTNYNVNRIYGENRYKTSINISKNFSNETVDNVIIASGNDFPDALAGSVLSKKLNAPILLVDKDIEGSRDSIDYIKDHLNTNGTIYILGGNASVSESYVNYIKSQGYKNVVRLGGKNRFDTNNSIVNFMNIEKGTPIVIANAYGFADALSVSSVAGSKGYPILMSDSKKLSEEIKEKIRDIQPSQVYLIGGQGSLSDNIISEVESLVPSLANNIVRIGGSSRYDTSLEICKYFNLNSETAVIANGENFPDALSGSTLASKENAPIILTDGQDISKQKKYIDSTKYKNLIILGGTGAVSQLSEDLLSGAVNELDIIKSKSLYSFDMSDGNGQNYTINIFSDDKQMKEASSSDGGWAFVWAGASEGDKLSRGHYKIALSKDGESDPEIYDVDNNQELTLNLSRELIRVHKNIQEGQPDFLLMGSPQSSNTSAAQVYYIKDGQLKLANFVAGGESSDYTYTFNSASLFFNQKEENTFETSSYDNVESFGFYIESWKFNVASGDFIFLSDRFMNTEDYSSYSQN